MPKRGGSRGRHTLGRTDRVKVAKKGKSFFITVNDESGRYITMDIDALFDLADLLDDICDSLDDEEQQ